MFIIKWVGITGTSRAKNTQELARIITRDDEYSTEMRFKSDYLSGIVHSNMISYVINGTAEMDSDIDCYTLMEGDDLIADIIRL